MTSDEKQKIKEFLTERTGPLPAAALLAWVQEALGKAVSERTLQRQGLTPASIPTRSLIVEHRPTGRVGAYRGPSRSGDRGTAVVEGEGKFFTVLESELVLFRPDRNPQRFSNARKTKSTAHCFTWPTDASMSWVEMFAGSNRLYSNFRKQMKERPGPVQLTLRRLESAKGARTTARKRGEPYGPDDFAIPFEELKGEELQSLLSGVFSWWSPRCTTVGKQASSKHRRMAWNLYLGVTELSFQWNGILDSMADALISRVLKGPKWNGKPHLFCIENPDIAAFKKHPAIIKILEKVPDAKIAQVKYCRFGTEYEKATAIVTNSVRLQKRLDEIMAEPICSACNEGKKHKTLVHFGNCKKSAWLPNPLCEVINEEIIAELGL